MAAGGGEVAAQEAQASLAGPTERLALRLTVGPRRRDQRVRGAVARFEIAGHHVGPEHDGACPALDPVLARLDGQVDGARQHRQRALRRRHHQVHAARHQGGREVDALAGRLEDGDACLQQRRELRVGVQDLAAMRFVACDRREHGIVGFPAEQQLVVELTGLPGARVHHQVEGELAVEVPQERPVAPGGGREAQRGARVSFLGRDALPPDRPLRVSRDGPLRGPEEIAHPARVARAGVLVLAGLGQAFERELAHGLEQVKARDPVLLAAGEEALVGQRRQAVQRVDAGVRGDLGGRLLGEAAREHAEPSEERLLVGPQQIVAPGERGAQRLLAGGQIAPLAREQGQRSIEARQHRLRRQDARPRGGQLDGQGEAVQAAADLRDRGVILGVDAEVRAHLLGALLEQAHAGGQRVPRRRHGSRAAAPVARARPARAATRAT